MSSKISDFAEDLGQQKCRIKNIETDIREDKHQIKALENLRRILEDVKNINSMSKGKLRSSIIEDIPRMTDKVPELALRIKELENGRFYHTKIKVTLQQKLETLEGQLRLKRSVLREKQNKLFTQKGYTCWNMRKMHKENIFEAKNHANKLTRSLEKIKVELESLNRCSIQQTKLIGELTVNMSESVGLNEEYKSLHALLEEKRTTLVKLKEEIEQDNRLSSQKSRILTKKQLICDPIAHYDVKKRILQSDLRKVTESRRTEEKKILAQENRILQLVESKHTMISILRSKQEKESGEYIPKLPPSAEQKGVFFQKCAEILSLIDENRKKAVELYKSQKDIEKSEIDIAVVTKSKISSARRHALANKARLEAILELESHIATRERAYQQQKKQLERNNEALEHEIQRKSFLENKKSKNLSQSS